MTEQQENKTFAKMLKEFPKTFGRVSFRERLMLRAAFDYVNEEVIADIKANCDFALEGKDVEIKELKDHLAEEVELHLHAEGYIKSLEKENAELEKDKAYAEEQLDKQIEATLKLQKEYNSLKETNAILSESAAINHKDMEYKISVIEQRNKRIEELKQQIEKMKCCGNCKGVCNSDDVAYFCKNNDYKLWEIEK